MSEDSDDAPAGPARRGGPSAPQTDRELTGRYLCVLPDGSACDAAPFDSHEAAVAHLNEQAVREGHGITPETREREVCPVCDREFTHETHFIRGTFTGDVCVLPGRVMRHGAGEFPIPRVFVHGEAAEYTIHE